MNLNPSSPAWSHKACLFLPVMTTTRTQLVTQIFPPPQLGSHQLARRGRKKILWRMRILKDQNGNLKGLLGMAAAKEGTGLIWPLRGLENVLKKFNGSKPAFVDFVHHLIYVITTCIDIWFHEDWWSGDSQARDKNVETEIHFKISLVHAT